MRIGLSPFASSRDEVLALAERAVSGGLDTLWLGDGYLTNPDFTGWAGGMESLTELAWLAGRFPEARIGITAAVLPMRDVPWTAKQANTLARVAGGGFVLVAAPGFWRQDIEARGVDHDSRGEVYARLLDELTEALTDARLSPGPPADGPVPLWLAGGRATMERALARALPFQSSRMRPDDLAPVAADYFERGGVKLAHRVRVEPGAHQVQGREVEWNAVGGSIAEVVDALGRYRDMGVSDLSIVPGQDDATSRRTVETLVTEIVPQLG